MKKSRIVSTLLTLWLMGSLAGAQSQDWQAVEKLKPRTLISVEDMHHIIHDTCRFHGVVDGQLFCGYSFHPFGPNEIAFRQQSIRAVRKEHNSALIGLAIGAGAGAIIGVSRDAYPGIGRGGSALVGAGLLGGMGAIGGSVVGHISHGKVIYQNPNDPPRARGSAQPSWGLWRRKREISTCRRREACLRFGWGIRCACTSSQHYSELLLTETNQPATASDN